MNKVTLGTKLIELFTLQALLVFCPVLWMFCLVLQSTQAHFTYSLDDAYIHLALAQQIEAGHYGINPHEASAPSSSIIWPFLLALFAHCSIFEYIPLMINIVCLGGLVVCLNKFLPEKPLYSRLIIIAVLLLSVNAYGLVFTGMEHSLQLLLVAVVAVLILSPKHCVKNEGDSLLPWYGYLVLILLPLVRYEDLAIALPILLYLAYRGKHDRIPAAITLLVITASLLGFSFFLYCHQLGFVPSSILVKTNYGHSEALLNNLKDNLNMYGFMLLPVYGLCIYFGRTDKGLAGVIIAVTVLHFIFGRHGWFGRYEGYWLLFVLIFGCHSIRRFLDRSLVYLYGLLIMPLAFWSLIDCTFNTPLAAANIYYQQAQTAKIVKMLAEPVAINDLGLVALRSHQYVLDLAGLANLEALQLQRANTGAEWVEPLMHAKDVKFAFVYDKWFPEKPAFWQKVAELKLENQKVLLVSDTVAFYAVDEQSKAKLKAVMQKFSETEKSDYFSVKMF